MFKPISDMFGDDYGLLSYCHIMKLLKLMLERDMITEKDADWIIEMIPENMDVPKRDNKK